MFIFLLNLANFAQDKEIKSFSLDEVIDQALKNNLDLQIEMTNPEIAKALWDKSAAIFIPTLSLDFSRASNTTPSSNIFTGADVEKSDSATLAFTLSQNLLFGGNLNVSLDNSRNSTNNALQPDQPPL